jgi:microsomal dipeptidase-like Zn-dependent dipeptidase
LQLPDGIDTVADYPSLLPVLRAAHLSERQIEKVCSRNFRRVFDEVLP